MFKNGECYDLSANQGAGGYIGGTSTSNVRAGNIKHGIRHPFISLPNANLTLNFLGLPNLGDTYLSTHTISKQKQTGCPIGWSLMRSPDYGMDESMERLIHSLWLYHDKAEIDFIEINESCPNIDHKTAESVSKNSLEILENRLIYIANNFLAKRCRNLPVILKLSTDLRLEELPNLLNLLIEYKYDGINIGNTSTNYQEIKLQNNNDQRLFDYFTQNIGGGIGGEHLKQKSLQLCTAAVKYIRNKQSTHEFHVIRCGGITDIQDILDSDNAGISLNQWYSGYFKNYIHYGDELYAKIFSNY
jgi:dihydroorotate dehydrogenase